MENEEQEENHIQNINEEKGLTTPLWKFISKIALLVGILGGLAETLNFIDLFPNTVTREDTISLTVYIHNSKGKQYIQSGVKGELIVDFKSDRRVAKISENGRINFGEIPHSFIGEKISFGLKSKDFQLVNPKRKYIINRNPIYLSIKENEIVVFSGRTVDEETNEFISNVEILIQKTSLNFFSDTRGNFYKKASLKNQAFPVELTALKDGYAKKKVLINGVSSDNIIIRLEKEK